MSGSHRALKVRRWRLGGAVGIASAGVLLAATSGVAVASVGTSAPAPEDCTSLVQALITAQVAEDRNANAVRKAEREDDAARSVNEQAKTDAQTQYNADVAAAPADDLKTKGDEHAAAIAAAADKRDKANARADQAYTDGKTADRLAAARGKESKTSAALGVIKLDIGKVCTRTPQQPPALTPPSPPEAQQSQVAPAPETVQTHLPVTH